MNRILSIINLPDIDITRILSLQQRQYGFQLCEDDHVVTLVKNGTEVAHWNSSQVTVKAIYDECDRYLGGDAVEALRKIGGISFGGN